MRRRLALLATLATAVAVLGSAPAAGARAPDPRPNIIVVVTDDQAPSSLTPEMMPAVSRLIAGGGVRFLTASNPTPLCCPSRAAFLTGEYGHDNGVLWNAPGYRALRAKRNTLPVWMERAGYMTAHVGKYLNAYAYAQKDPTATAPGWREWHTFIDPNSYYSAPLVENGRMRHTGTSPRDYTTTVINRIAVKMIRRYVPRRKPLFMVVDQFAPHRSGGPSLVQRCAPPGPEPAVADRDLFADAPLPRPPSFNEPDVTDKPSFIQAREPFTDERLAALERTYRCTLASLREVDRGVAEIWKALGAAGERSNTAIVFTSDNGLYFGEHRLSFEKIVPYRESLEVPLAMRLPRSTSPRPHPGLEVTQLVANLDLTATILDLAKADPCRTRRDCRTLDGRSLLPLAAGRNGQWPANRAMPLELNTGGRPSDADSSCAYTGVRTQAEIYLEHTSVAGEDGSCAPARELEHYDLSADPFQLTNLIAAPTDPAAEQARVGELAALAARLSRCTGIHGRDRRTAGRPFCE